MSAVADWLRGAILRDMRAEPRLNRRNAVICLDCDCLTGPQATACPACASRSLVLAFPEPGAGVVIVKSAAAGERQSDARFGTPAPSH